nr:phosphotransferase [Aliamphritea spongicola]
MQHCYAHACSQLKTSDWHPLNTQGTSNYLFRENTGQQILRINAPAERAVGVCRSREAGIMSLLQNQPWMVNVISNQPDSGWCCLHDYGEHSSSEIMNAAQAQLLEIIRQLQTVPASAQTLNFKFEAIWQTYEQIITEHQGNKEKRAACQTLRQELRNTIELQQQLPSTPVVLGHQDLHPGNLSLNNGQLILLDWEYAGLCQPWLDAAGLITQFNFTSEAVNQLPAFSHLSEEQFSKAADTAVRFNKQLEVLWFQAREIAGEQE